MHLFWWWLGDWCCAHRRVVGAVGYFDVVVGGLLCGFGGVHGWFGDDFDGVVLWWVRCRIHHDCWCWLLVVGFVWLVGFVEGVGF